MSLQAWYAIYTKPRNEKRVEERFASLGLETYLPLHKVLRQWSDRRKKVEVPLINSYVFVKAGEDDFHRVLDTDGVVRFLFYLGKPARIRAAEIEAMKRFLELSQGYRVWLQPDEDVEITEGPLKGSSGRIERIGKDKIRLRIEQLRLVIHAEIDRSSVQPLKKG